MTVRQFLHNASDARNAVQELLQTIFAAELLAPSGCLWIVSPWLRDIPVLDNTMGGLLALCPEFPRTEIRLSRVLRELLARGSTIVIATRPEPENRQVLDAMGVSLGRGGPDRLAFRERADLHAKGLVGDRYALTGSMNFTHNGVERLNEMLLFQNDRDQVEHLRVVFREEYGGAP